MRNHSFLSVPGFVGDRPCRKMRGEPVPLYRCPPALLCFSTASNAGIQTTVQHIAVLVLPSWGSAFPGKPCGSEFHVDLRLKNGFKCRAGSPSPARRGERRLKKMKEKSPFLLLFAISAPSVRRSLPNPAARGIIFRDGTPFAFHETRTRRNSDAII